MEALKSVCLAGGAQLDPLENLVILDAGKPFQFVLPNFPVLAVALQQILVEKTDIEDETVKFHAFIRHAGGLTCPLSVTVTDYCVLKPSMLTESLKTDELKLPPEGVYVLWQWQEIEDHLSQVDTLLHEDSSSQNTECDEDDIGTHTVTFKCIGASKTSDSQTILKTVSELLADNHNVPVDIFPEPENPYDSRAIAFKVCIDSNQWHTIGYVVSEATEAVHTKMSKNEIKSVKFAWARYLISWSRSGPGYYAGINITARGRWPNSVVKCASTK